jgi:hypothetical protein
VGRLVQKSPHRRGPPSQRSHQLASRRFVQLWVFMTRSATVADQEDRQDCRDGEPCRPRPRSSRSDRSRERLIGLIRFLAKNRVQQQPGCETPVARTRVSRHVGVCWVVTNPTSSRIRLPRAVSSDELRGTDDAPGSVTAAQWHLHVVGALPVAQLVVADPSCRQFHQVRSRVADAAGRRSRRRAWKPRISAAR